MRREGMRRRGLKRGGIKRERDEKGGIRRVGKRGKEDAE